MNQEKINDLLHKVMDIKHDTQQVLDEISRMDSAYEEQTGREQALEREVTINTAQANAWKKEYDKIKDQYQGLYDNNVGLKREVADLKAQVNALEQPEQPTMPVIPKAVAIAIFREGMAYGASNVCDELDNSSEVEVSDYICESGFEVNFTKYVDLSDKLDLDYLRNSVSECDDSSVIGALKFLCANEGFECRIHGIDDNPTNPTVKLPSGWTND